MDQDHSKVAVSKVPACTIESELLQMVKELVKDTAKLGTKMDSLEVLQQNVNTLLADASEQKTAIANLSRSMHLYNEFHSSDSFKGKRYHLSKVKAKFDIEAADQQCMEIGGYLVEIDDQEEFDFVVDFIRPLADTKLYTGGNNLENSSEWRFWHTKRPVQFFNWEAGQPDNFGGDENCMELKFYLNGFNDLNYQFDEKFICETEIQKKKKKPIILANQGTCPSFDLYFFKISMF